MPGQSQVRREPGLPLRPGAEPHVPGLAAHYGTAVLPARPGKARDKAKVESAVLIAERWIIAVLRHRKFFSLAELNAAIRVLLVKFNNRRFKKLPGSARRVVPGHLDAPALRPLPAARYEFCELDQGRGEHRLPRRRSRGITTACRTS